MILAVALIAGCASLGGTEPSTRQFSAPMSRVKPAFVSTLASMGMMITSLEARGGHEIIKAKKAGGEVEIDLEPVGRDLTRARVGAWSGGLLYDDETAARVLRQAGQILGKS